MKTKLLWIKTALFSCYIEVCADFVAFSGTLGGMAEFDILGSIFEGHDPSHGPVNRYMRRNFECMLSFLNLLLLMFLCSFTF